jgi:ankyrin repeat protein
LLEHAGLETVLSMGYQVGRTALMLAVTAGHLEICQALLRAGADPNQTDVIQNTALALAVEQNRFEIVQALVAAGADVNQVVAERNTAFLLACGLGAVEIGEFLIAQGASIAPVNSNNETALIRAAAAGSLPLVRLCLAQDIDVNVVGSYPGTALSATVDASRDVQVDPDDRSSGCRTREYRDDGSCWENQPLSEAEIIPIVQLLLSAEADPNIPNCETTPLIAAAQRGYLNLLELLLAAGARLEVTNNSGDTPVSMAQLYDQHRVLAWLRNYTGTDLSEFAQVEDDADDEEDEERWGEDLPRPDFSAAAQSPDYQQAVQELGELCGSQPTEFEEVIGWYSVHVDTKRRASLDPDQIQRQFLERGYFVYMPDHYSRGIPERFCILPTTDKYKVIALHQTNGCNCGIGPGYVVEWLQELEAEQPFTLTCIAHDTLAGKFLTPIADPDGWAEQMYEFCPDIVDQGCGSVERLAESLASSDNLFFWWD